MVVSLVPLVMYSHSFELSVPLRFLPLEVALVTVAAAVAVVVVVEVVGS